MSLDGVIQYYRFNKEELKQFISSDIKPGMHIIKIEKSYLYPNQYILKKIFHECVTQNQEEESDTKPVH